ncbi:MAG: hypothetical protein IKC89_01735 [Lentisphaeria bacterium]|nr:hypothetical protein [Lentisphaeria bacterium]
MNKYGKYFAASAAGFSVCEIAGGALRCPELLNLLTLLRLRGRAAQLHSLR